MSLKTPMLFFSCKTDPNFLHLTDFSAPDKMFVLIKSDKERHLFANELEFGRANKQSCCTVHSLSEDRFANKKPLEVLDVIVKDFGLTETIYVTDDFPCSMYKHLMDQGLKVEVVSSLLPTRRTKTPKEIEYLKIANNVSCLCFKFIRDVLKKSTVNEQTKELIYDGKVLTSEWIKTQVELISAQNESTPFDTIIACGKDGTDPHNEGSGPVYANQFLICDIFPRHKSGYFGDMTRTFMKGKPTEAQKKQYDAVLKAHHDCIDMVKEGVSYKDVTQFCYDQLEKAGFAKKLIGKQYYGMIHSLGHGTGLEIHEEPWLTVRFDTYKAQKMDSFTIEPGLYYPEEGGVRIEDSLYMDENGVVHKMGEFDYEGFVD